MKQTELLLPAGHDQALKAAIAAGADAVYLAGSAYGARAGAGNFDEGEMKRALQLAHRHDVLVYVAMNTLIGDDEMDAALDYAKFLYDHGADALIVQDWGLAASVKSLLPAFDLHGSTQMTIHNVRGARFAREFGFKRVILAREMTLTEIKAVREEVPDLELEVFCHGALCICYSGQCLMSSMIGGRSGNRGRCAQPCRLVYDLYDGFGKSLVKKPAHLLSPRDLHTLSCLPDLLSLDLSALKVEGRMRRPEYVATVGRAYRRALDRWYAGDYDVDAQDLHDVEQAFNRDFTTGYYRGNPGLDLMSRERPNNRGVLIGRVKSAQSKRVVIELNRELRVGDGIEIWVKVGGRCGMTVSSLWVNGQKVPVAQAGQLAEVVVDGRVNVGDRVFKTHDDLLMRSVSLDEDKIDATIPLHFQVIGHLGQPLRVSAVDGRGRRAEHVGSYQVEAAKTSPTDETAIEKQLTRLGHTGYHLASLTVDLDEQVILPASVLNQARRALITMLDAQNDDRHPPLPTLVFNREKQMLLATKREKKKNNVPFIAVKVQDIPQIQAALDGGAEVIYFAPHLRREQLSVKDLEKLTAWNQTQPATLVYALPSVSPQDDEDKLKATIATARDCGFRHFLLGQVGDIYWQQSLAEADFWGDTSLNVFNGQTAQVYYDAGLSGVTCSYELTKEDLLRLAHQPGAKEVVVHGAIPLMISRHCLVGASQGVNPQQVPCGYECGQQRYTLEDRLGMHFPVLPDIYHLTHIYNCKDLALIDELPSLLAFDRWRIEGQLYDIGSLREIIVLYRQGREHALTHGKVGRKELFDALRAYQPAGYTKGHFLRGVKK